MLITGGSGTPSLFVMLTSPGVLVWAHYFKTQSIRSDVKTADAELARLQAFVLDPVGPLVEVLEGIDRETISAEDTSLALSESLRLLGNA